ncbi:MAG TPA: winged helix-turn-helix domain-containing protein, partial [Nitrososphaeraceae archaeon]|nr:winged helix-turn-helix domain-containing protein [Nitrososphaeraceae archaeon]
KRISIQKRRMDYKTGRRSDCQKKSGGGIRYHYTHIYRLMHKWGFKQKVPRKVHVNTASREEKERFKKEQERYWII